MKNIITTVSVFCLIFILNSCGKAPSEMIVGEWKIADLKTTQEISEDQLESHKEAIEDMKASSSLVINADGTYENTISESVVKGKWSINEDATKLTLTDEEGNAEVSEIVELSENKLTISKEVYEVTNTIFYEKKQ